ncbi:MAG: hypothetical protein PHH85_09405 [Candidatus Methanoperedens sp.]|nr:hypothetical protein [Candidatus Methanoperedens sp.]
MNTLKSIFAILILIVPTPVYASEDDNPLRIENLTSISSIVNPATLELAKSVNAAPEWRNFIPPQAFWSPDGSKLLIRSTIGWYKDDINFRPSNRNGIAAIYKLDADGTNLTKIVSNEINNRSTPIEFPTPLSNNYWSPSGDKIAIIVYKQAGSFYILANPDGKGLIALGTNFSDIITIITNLSKISRQRDLIWNPDGTKAVFVVNDPDKIYITDADGNNIKQIAAGINESFLGAVTWSHDGKRIAFSGRNLWIMNSDGTNLRQFGDCWGGAWSPDDSKLLCMSSEEVNDQFIRHLYLINLDSGDKTELIKSIWVENPTWSPDGNNILFKSITERSNAIYVTDSHGRDIKLIYESSPVDRATLEAVTWSPDGSKISFVSHASRELYTINPDGTGRILISSNLSGGYAWSPSGDKIAFSSSTANGEHIFISNPDGTERVQITTGENKRYILSGLGGSWSPDGSGLLIESSTYRASRNEVFIAKLSGYEKTVSVRAGIATPAPQTTKPITAAATPNAPGFASALTLAILSTIYFIKRRYN